MCYLKPCPQATLEAGFHLRFPSGASLGRDLRPFFFFAIRGGGGRVQQYFLK